MAQISDIMTALSGIDRRLAALEKGRLGDREYLNELDERIAQPVNAAKSSVDGLRTRVDSLIGIMQKKGQ